MRGTKTIHVVPKTRSLDEPILEASHTSFESVMRLARSGLPGLSGDTTTCSMF